MRNLFDSPFLYWEKIGFVGFNNYTDLHLKVKKDLVYHSWGFFKEKKSSLIALNLSSSRNSYNNNDKINYLNNILLYSKNKKLKKKKYKYYLILDYIFYILKKIYIIQELLFKIYYFFKVWKKKKYFILLQLIRIKKNKINNNYIFNYLKSINNIFFIFLKCSIIFFKKLLLNVKKKSFLYFKYFSKFSFFRKKKKNILNVNKYLYKNVFLIYKNPMLLNKYNSVLNLKNNNVLSDNTLFRNLYYNENKLFRNGVFKDIPNNYSFIRFKKFKFFIYSVYNISWDELKKIIYRYQINSWKELYFVVNNRLISIFKNDIYGTSINNLRSINGNNININDSFLLVSQGDIIEFDVLHDCKQWFNFLEKKIFDLNIFFFFSSPFSNIYILLYQYYILLLYQYFIIKY